jgi:hypothetical protein
MRIAMTLVALIAASASASAQLSGTYTIGPSDSYPTIEAAIGALNTNGVSGPVTFLISGGTITPPSTGYTLAAVASMNATNTVTFKPKPGAAVTIDGSIAGAIFKFDGGDYYVIDGTNGSGTTTRDLKVINRNTSNPVVLLINAASYNTIRYVNLIGAATSSTTGVVKCSTATAGGNSYNRIVSNTIGDSTGTVRATTGIYGTGTSTTGMLNVGNVYDDNYIVNFLTGSTSGYGIYLQSSNQRSRISRNRITNPIKGTATGGVEGIRFDNNVNNLEDTIALNRIWDVGSTSATATQVGIRDYYQTLSSPLYIYNNMVSLVSTGSASLYGIYLDPTVAADVEIHNNAISIAGTNAATAQSYCLYMTSYPSVTLRNNILVNTRTGTSVNGNRAIYKSSTSNTLISSNNLYYVPVHSSSALVYHGGTVYTMLSAWQAAGSDASSVDGDPRFVDAPGGDLHISTSLATPVESTGMPIPWIATDYDGNARNATTPDIGADEGAFVSLPANEMRAIAILTPVSGTTFASGVAFSPTGIVYNGGTAAQSVAVRFIIRDASNAVVYEDLETTPTIPMTGSLIVTFGQSGNVSGSTILGPGSYTMEMRTELATDVDNTNNSVTGSFMTRAPFNGSYTINPFAAPSTTNYTSFTSALTDLAMLGVTGPVTFTVTSGTYSSGETFPLSFRQFPGVSSTNRVTFRPAAGATVVIEATNTTAAVLFDGADYLTIDGSNTVGGTSRDLTIRNLATSGSAVRIFNGSTYDVVKNAVLQGSSTSTSDGIVTILSGTAANSFNTITANTIGDVNGVVRSLCAVYMAGSSTALNASNVIDNNDVVNFLTSSSTGYGIHVYDYNQRTRISNNRITNPVKSTTTGGVWAIRWDNNESNLLDTISGNRIWDVGSGSATALIYGIVNWYHSAGASLVIVNNMISIATDATAYGIYNFPSYADSLYIIGNTIRVASANSASGTSYTVYSTSSSNVVMRDNILTNERVGSGSNYVYYLSSGTLSSNNNVLAVAGAGTIGYASSARPTPALWQAAGYDANSSFVLPPFVNAATGDLHIDPVRVFEGEAFGAPTWVTTDIDGQARDAVTPDIGADEGNFNGGRLSLQYPNGGEQLPVDFDLAVRWTATRPVPTYVDFSSDNGVTWTRMATIPTPAVGANTTTITTPSIEMTTARVRVISQINAYEADTSNSSFSLFRPVFSVIRPNGGERLVPTDTAQVVWTSQFVPAGVTVTLEYSTNGGSSWLPLADGVTSRNLPDTNVYAWTVPDVPGTNNLVRVLIPGSRSIDASNAPFAILQKPSVSLTSLNDGVRLFAGEKALITWTATNTMNVRLEYSVDGGASWMNLLPGGRQRLGSTLGSFEWTVPAVNAATALVRVVNDERTRFADASDRMFEIVVGDLEVLSPNGGEKYELGQPVTVRFDAPHSTTLRLDYSYDGGATWQLIAASIDATAGSYTFTPPGIPTPRALVRLVDESRVALSDASDAPFEIMEARSITIFTPGQGERIMRSTTFPITWQSIRINRVNIDYSPSGGIAGSWTRIATDISAALGTFNWNVPSQNTDNGVIRISEVGGSIVAQSGEFSIVAPVTSVRVLRPNGGESYTAGDEIIVSWTAANVATVSLEYSSDGGASWYPMASNLPATQGTYRWTAPVTPSNGYRVKVISGALNDMSDANFTVLRRIVPTLTVLYPNGGETLGVDSTVTVAWLARDISGPVIVTYSTDNGATWLPLGTGDAATGAITWTVPATLSQQALVGVEGAGGVADVSDAVFSIVAPIVHEITLNTPNSASTVWKEAENVTVTWTSQNIADVMIELSLDNGTSWTTTLTPSVPAATGTFTWRVPHLADTEMTSLRVKVSSADGAPYFATSSESFIYRPAVAGIERVTTGEGGMTIAGVYPNPVSTATELRWQQAAAGTIELRVYSIDGTLVRSYTLGRLEAGAHAARIDAATLPVGLYVYELRSSAQAARGTFTIVR